MVDSAKIDRIKIFFSLGLTYKNKYNPSIHAIYPRSKGGLETISAGRNSYKHGENMQTRHRKLPVNQQVQTQSLQSVRK